jgi:ligand-binding sensor domain-containing protein
MVFCRRVLYAITFILFIKMSKAQNAEPVFKHLQLGDGLSNNTVNCILQDERGFLWFGTEDGLNRYDGKFFEVFENKTHDSTGISGKIRIEQIFKTVYLHREAHGNDAKD